MDLGILDLDSIFIYPPIWLIRRKTCYKMNRKVETQRECHGGAVGNLKDRQSAMDVCMFLFFWVISEYEGSWRVYKR